MSDVVTALIFFVGFVALVVVVGILVGIIVAGRIDRILAPRVVPGPDPAPPAEDPDEVQP